jgi:hypothetical protein
MTSPAPLTVPGNLGDLIAWLGMLRTADFRYELEKLRALRRWAFEQAGIGYEEGDTVRLAPGYAVSRLNRGGSLNGWWHYRECLAGGATGTAVRIDFSPHQMAWYTEFRPDRGWSVAECGGATVRHWHGPAAETPEGYEPPSAFDREHYPDGRTHVFRFLAADLLKAAPA